MRHAQHMTVVQMLMYLQPRETWELLRMAP